MRIFFATLALVLIALPARAENVLRRGNRYEPATLDPHKQNTLYEEAIALDLFEGLTCYGPDGGIQPGVASAWSVSADGLAWTFTLRSGLRWSDGAPLTTDDVVFSFRRVFDPATTAILAPAAGAIKNARAILTGTAPPETLGVRAPDAGTIVIALDSPAPYLPELLAKGFLAIVPQHAVARLGDAWIKPGVEVGNGAFVLKDWVPQGEIVLVRNPAYRDAGSVMLDRVIYYPTEDLEAAVTRFRAGQLDTQREFPTPQLETLARILPAETHVTPALQTAYLAFNTRRAQFQDARVRAALSMAIDREVLATRVLRGGQRAATGWVPPGMPDYAPARMRFADQPMTARLAQAQALLAGAGYGPARHLKVTLSYSNVSDIRRIAIAVAAMWRPLGVDAALEGTESKMLFANLRGGDYDVGFAIWTADDRDPATFLDVLRGGVAANYSRYANAAYDRSLDVAARTADRAQRAAILRDAEATMLNDAPIAPLVTWVSKDLVSQAVHGWQANTADVHLSRYLSVARVAP